MSGSYGIQRKWIVLLTGFLVALILLLTTTDKDIEKYKKLFKHYDTGCLIESDKGKEVEFTDDYLYPIILFHYFEDKDLTIINNFEASEETKSWVKELYPKIDAKTSDSYEVNFDKAAIEEVKDYTHRLKTDGCRYFIDESWKASKSIIAFEWDEDVYFVTEELFEGLNSGEYEKFFLSEEELETSNIKYLSQVRGEKDIYQVVIIAILFVIGLMINLLVYRGDNYSLSAFMAIPTSVAIYCMVGIIAIMLGIPINKAYVFILLGLFIAVIAICYVRAKTSLSIKKLSVSIVSGVAVIAYFVYQKIWFFATDSLEKTLNAALITEGALNKKQYLEFISFGMLEPIIHNLGWKFHVDFLYALCPLMMICSVGVIIFGIRKLYGKSTWRNAVIACSVFFFLTNMDILINGFYILSNGMVGCLTLIMILGILLKIKEGLSTEIIVLPIIMTIITTRVEGTCYICLILALFCGCKAYREKCKTINSLAALEIMFWQVGLMLFCTENSIFWSMGKGLMLAAAGVAVLVLPYILNSPLKIFDYLKKYYYRISVISLFLVAVLLWLFGPEMSRIILPTFVQHFSRSYLSNSGALWSFIVLMLPLIVINKKKTTGLLVAIVADYLLLTYLIFCFRKGVPIHNWTNDSCRRVIQQIIPTAMFMVSYILCETVNLFEGVKDE